MFIAEVPGKSRKGGSEIFEVEVPEKSRVTKRLPVVVIALFHRSVIVVEKPEFAHVPVRGRCAHLLTQTVLLIRIEARSHSCLRLFMKTAVKRIWHVSDNQGLAFEVTVLKTVQGVLPSSGRGWGRVPSSLRTSPSAAAAHTCSRESSS